VLLLHFRAATACAAPTHGTASCAAPAASLPTLLPPTAITDSPRHDRLPPAAPAPPPPCPQVKYLLGLKIPRTDTLQDTLEQIFNNISTFKWREWCMGMSFVFVLLAFKQLSGRFRRLRILRALGPLTVCVLSIALMNIFGWWNHPNAKSPYIKPIGNIPSGERQHTRHSAA
jgi:hypothetical protein